MYPAKDAIVRKIVFHCQCEDRVNSDFRRISYMFISQPLRTVVQYIGCSSVVVSFPHGNAVQDNRAYIQSCPSVISNLKTAVQNNTPSNVYKASTGSYIPPLLHPVKAPRNCKQAQNATYAVTKTQRLSQDSIYNLLEIAYDLDTFVHHISVYPNLAVVCGSTDILKRINLSLLVSPTQNPALISYDTTFCLGDLYVSVLIFRMVLFSSAPFIPGLFFIHNSKTTAVHREFFDTARQLLPNLESTNIPIITDREGGIVNAISQSLSTAQHVLGWNHLLQDAKRYVKAHGCEVDNVQDTVRNLLLCESQEMYEAALEDKSSEWPESFKAYFTKSVDPVVKEKLG